MQGSAVQGGHSCPVFAGEGVLFNPAVGFELLRTAAERGDAEAQAYLGFRLAMGVYPPLPGKSASMLMHTLDRRLLCCLLALSILQPYLSIDPMEQSRG